MQDYKETLIACVVTLLTILLPDIFPDRLTRGAFIAATILAIFLYLKGHKENSPPVKRFSYVLGTGLALVMVVSIIWPEFSFRFWERDTSGEQEESLSPMEAYQAGRQNVGWSLNGLQYDIDRAAEELSELSGALRAQVLLSKEAYPDEIWQVTKKLEADQDIIEETFSEMQVDVHDLELYYKTRLYGQVCHYGSIIDALEDYGISCKDFGVDEYTLLLWDVENLYILYSMKKEIEPELLEEEAYDSKRLYFDEHKVFMDEYSDLFNYNGWHFDYKDRTAKEIEEELDDHIMCYYKRLHLNFSRKTA